MLVMNISANYTLKCYISLWSNLMIFRFRFLFYVVKTLVWIWLSLGEDSTWLCSGNYIFGLKIIVLVAKRSFDTALVQQHFAPRF